MTEKNKRPVARRWRYWLAGMLAIAIIAAFFVYRDPEPPRPKLGPITAAEDARGQWPVYGNTPGGSRYSELEQINPSNVGALEVAWTFHTGALDRFQTTKADPKKPHGYYSMQMTPILVEGKLIGCAHDLSVFAIDPESGRVIWRYQPELASSQRGVIYTRCRGVTAWTDPAAAVDAPCHTRVLTTHNATVTALDARTGQPCAGFGRNGSSALPIAGAMFPDEVQLRSPGAIVGDVIIFGSTIIDVYRTNSPSGAVRAVDLRTGALRWAYDPIPRDPKDPDYATWGKDSASYIGASNVWSFLSVDPVNKLVFLPTTSPGADFYGAHRPGTNRGSSSLVALSAETGKRVWSFQTTHHDIFDTDLPSQPILADITKDGKKIPAVIQLTKQGYVFVFNRLTGIPVFPIEERKVPQGSDIPGEWISPTQPTPAVIPALNPVELKPDDAWGLTPIDRYFCKRAIAATRSEGLFTPPTRKGTLFYPGVTGGSNWSGGAFDPGRNLLIVPTLSIPEIITLIPRADPGKPNAPKIADRSADGFLPMFGTPYRADLKYLTSPIGMPCSPPPWARLSAIDLATGKIAWQVPFGTIKHLNPLAPPWLMGAPFMGGPIVTNGGLAFIGASTDRKFRAFDTRTGKELWWRELPAAGMATPMTYSIKGRQYVVIAAGGNNLLPGKIDDALVAFALPR